jgi:hypothetical protein
MFAVAMRRRVAALRTPAIALHQDPPTLAGSGRRLLLSDELSEGESHSTSLS